MPDESSARPAPVRTRPASAPGSFRVVGIGAGPGALNALRSFFRMLPGNTGLAFVIVQHPGGHPDVHSTLPRLVAREAAMPVTVVDTPTVVSPDHVYIASAALSLDIRADTLSLAPSVCEQARTSPIDDLFGTLAHHLGPAATGVLLSGTEGDGHAGLQAIRSAGGDTFAERGICLAAEQVTDADALHGTVDVLASAVDIAARLTRLARLSLELLSSSESAAEEIAGLAAVLRASTGLDLQCYKRSTIDRRIARRMRALGAETLGEYLAIVNSDPDEVVTLHSELLIPVTRFFRDPAVFSALSDVVFPDILTSVDATRRVRMWVPGCSTGEEVYSLLMTHIESTERAGEHREVTIYGTDVSAAALVHAREGRYPRSIESDVSAERLARFFERDDCGYRIGTELREVCEFVHHDITSDAPLTNMHLVSMRNLLIYLRRQSQEHALASAFDALEPGGFLVLGTAETTGVVEGLFEVVEQGRRIYQRGDGRPARHS